MKKMRKLLPAFAMLLVSAVMMSTASFAWFSMNTTASASGMKVQATTSGGLAIAYAIPDASGNPIAPDKSTYKSSVTLAAGDYTNGATKINPTSVNINGTTWFKASSDKTDNYAANSAGYSTVTTNTNQYYYKTAIFVRSLAESADTSAVDLFVNQVKITTPDGTTGSALEKSLRVAINVGSTWLFFAPNYEAGTDVTDLAYVSSVTGTAGTIGNYTAAQMFPGQTLLTGAQLVNDGVAYTNPTQVNVYIYFEGEDANCTSALAYNLRDLSVEVIFTTED